MTRLFRPALFASLALLTASSLLATWPSAAATDQADDIVPSNVLRTETRQPGAFSRMVLEGPMNVEVRQGPRSSVMLKADDNVLPLLETTLEGAGPNATLRVRYRRDVHIRSKPHVDLVIETDRVEGISLGGIGDVLAKGIATSKLDIALGGVGNIALPALKTEALKITVGGSGSVKADGRARELTLSIAGSGHGDTFGLAADDVKVTIAGQGEAKVRADKSLAVTIAGSGDVVYRGDVTPQTTVIGRGTITKG